MVKVEQKKEKNIKKRNKSSQKYIKQLQILSETKKQKQMINFVLIDIMSTLSTFELIFFLFPIYYTVL